MFGAFLRWLTTSFPDDLIVPALLSEHTPLYQTSLNSLNIKKYTSWKSHWYNTAIRPWRGYRKVFYKRQIKLPAVYGFLSLFWVNIQDLATPGALSLSVCSADMSHRVCDSWLRGFKSSFALKTGGSVFDQRLQCGYNFPLYGQVTRDSAPCLK